ncbi:sigma-70 family RNA polymerase sigma factor [Actinomadura sp. NEAU-AAG7]|uniref:sigma-70 family RNA polymerase sigma factor n=1 Tax=Actinomadura sp. NEAU-AAG7 TaxID=2839640 RepID=UPI001BE3FAEC|nr:sigma-70 family RNA polymerase sigma factor [Actinomadura sp. NEAU-AAG7]MBT2208293.1 sigma-70 family RNA polymerase sigma factor [Actinomadura sp. NEAU-AAG7]
MDERSLASAFEEHRPRLRAVAQRVLGSAAEAEDAVQETWLRLAGAGAEGIENLGGWLTTVVGRVSLNMLRSRASRREDPLGERARSTAGGTTPEDEAQLVDSVGRALLVVLDTLTPAERLAFVLHDMFAMPFDQIAPIVERTPAAARKLASRARGRVRAAPDAAGTGLDRHGEVVEAFLAASRAGDFEALLSLLDPDVLMRADRAGVALGAADLVRGAAGVAETFSGGAHGARPALVDGAAGAVWTVDGRPRVVFDLTIIGGRITAIDLLAEPETLGALVLEPPAR